MQASTRSISKADLDRFANLFIDERDHYYWRVHGRADFFHVKDWLSDQVILDHLAGQCLVAVTRAEATKVLSVDLDCKHGPDAAGSMLKQYDRIRSLMPEPIVFRSSNSNGLHLYWLLQEEVPTTASLRLLSQYFSDQGILVGPGTCELRPTTTQCLRLPLGYESALLDPNNLFTYQGIGEDAGLAIEFLVTAPRHESQKLLERIASGCNQLQLTVGQSMTRSRPSSFPGHLAPQADKVPGSATRSVGLTTNEMAVLWQVTSKLDGLARYRQLQFLFDLVMAFKTAGTYDLALSKRRILQMTGVHSGTYQQRLDFAETVGLVACMNHARAMRCPRRFRLLMQPDGPGEFTDLSAAINGRNLSFLSWHMRRHIQNGSGQNGQRQLSDGIPNPVRQLAA